MLMRRDTTPQCGIFHLVMDPGSTCTERVISVEGGAPLLGSRAPLNLSLAYWLACERPIPQASASILSAVDNWLNSAFNFTSLNLRKSWILARFANLLSDSLCAVLV